MPIPSPTPYSAPSRLRQLPQVALALLLAMGAMGMLVSCGDPAPVPSPPKRFVYLPPPPRVATLLPADFFQWTRVLKAQHTEMAELQAKLAAQQEIHLANRFDDFLKADLANLPAEQLASLWHFADKGYFTVERKIIKKLLEDRLRENEPQMDPSTGSTVGDRAALLAKQNEFRLRDLRTAAEIYDKVHQGEFHIPTPANAEQLAALRDLAAGKLQTAAAEMAVLDQEIKALKDKLNQIGDP